MCGIISGSLIDKNYFNNYKNHIINLYLQSQIRGKHATGISCGNDLIENHSLPESSELFIKEQQFNKILEISKENNLIGHIRYSTSDIDYNQPIRINKRFSISHNGVITQREFKYWDEHYKNLLEDYKLKTKNDTELLGIAFYKFIKGDERFNPFIYFKNSSIAAVCLYRNKIYFFRNGKRPLYYYKNNKYFFVASTKDIFLRSRLKEKYIKKVEPFKIYIYSNGKIDLKNFEIIKKDWQC